MVSKVVDEKFFREEQKEEGLILLDQNCETVLSGGDK